MTALVTFDVSNTDVKDDDLASLATFCPNLRNLRMAGCVEISDAGLASISAHCSRLACLDASACVDAGTAQPMRYTSAALRELVQKCPDLVKMHLTYSVRGGITKKTLVELNDWRIANQGKMISFHLNDEVVVGSS